MKQLLILFCIFSSVSITGQTSATEVDNRDHWITTMDFVEVLNDHQQETLYYYNNNWKVLREMALAKKYIAEYQFLITPVDEESKVSIILMTTYANQDQYDKREVHFEELIKKKGALNLMNEIKPKDFRKIVFSKENVKHQY